MSATVCETALHPQTLHDEQIPQQPARYLWPSFSSLRASSSKSKSRPSALRVVTSEATPMPVQKSPSSSAEPTVPVPGVRASSDCPSRDSSAPANAAAAVREQARLPEPSSSPSATTKKVKAHHVRAKSTTAVGEPSIRLDSSSARTTVPRARAASSAAMGTQPHPRLRPRLPSMLSSVMTNPRAPVQTQMASTGDSELVGSFAPTSSTRERLLSILSVGAASSSATPSAPPSPRRAPLSLRLTTDRLQRLNSSERRRQSATSPIDSPATPIPSICRTPSSYSGSEYFPTAPSSTAPSSAGPATPVHTSAVLPPTRKSESSLHPVLESLERTSMFCVQTACATCGKHGSNFPCCPRCGEMWCSRTCRLQRGNGKRHICSKSG
ncbi:hypothetical protein OH77DRAFT_1425559 [Trametes cingulata]|nr:hypothetical protein OH77DRAFT_1425559 [Trametes cingulata]